MLLWLGHHLTVSGPLLVLRWNELALIDFSYSLSESYSIIISVDYYFGLFRQLSSGFQFPWNHVFCYFTLFIILKFIVQLYRCMYLQHNLNIFPQLVWFSYPSLVQYKWFLTKPFISTLTRCNWCPLWSNKTFYFRRDPYLSHFLQRLCVWLPLQDPWSLQGQFFIPSDRDWVCACWFLVCYRRLVHPLSPIWARESWKPNLIDRWKEHFQSSLQLLQAVVYSGTLVSPGPGQLSFLLASFLVLVPNLNTNFDE